MDVFWPGCHSDKLQHQLFLVLEFLVSVLLQLLKEDELNQVNMTRSLTSFEAHGLLYKNNKRVGKDNTNRRAETNESESSFLFCFVVEFRIPFTSTYGAY